MSNVFDQFKLEKYVFETTQGPVTLKPLSISQFMKIQGKYDLEKENTEDMLAMQYDVVSAALVDPRMSAKQLSELSQSALPMITEIFTEVTGTRGN